MKLPIAEHTDEYASAVVEAVTRHANVDAAKPCSAYRMSERSIAREI